MVFFVRPVNCAHLSWVPPVFCRAAFATLFTLFGSQLRVFSTMIKVSGATGFYGAKNE